MICVLYTQRHAGRRALAISRAGKPRDNEAVTTLRAL